MKKSEQNPAAIAWSGFKILCVLIVAAQIVLWHQGVIIRPFTTHAELAGLTTVSGEEHNVVGSMSETSDSKIKARRNCQGLSGQALTMCQGANVRKQMIAELKQRHEGTRLKRDETPSPVTPAHLADTVSEVHDFDGDSAPCLKPESTFDESCDHSDEEDMTITTRLNCEAHLESGCQAHRWPWIGKRGLKRIEEKSKMKQEKKDSRYRQVPGCNSIKLHTVVHGDYLSKYSENLPKFRRFYVPGASFHCTQQCNNWKPSEEGGASLIRKSQFHICGPS